MSLDFKSSCFVVDFLWLFCISDTGTHVMSCWHGYDGWIDLSEHHSWYTNASTAPLSGVKWFFGYLLFYQSISDLIDGTYQSNEILMQILEFDFFYANCGITHSFLMHIYHLGRRILSSLDDWQFSMLLRVYNY